LVPKSLVIDNSDRFFSELPENILDYATKGKRGGGRRILPKEIRSQMNI